MVKFRLLSSVLAVFSVVCATAGERSAVPRLVVGVVVDQLRTDYMEAFMPLYGENGFKRLLREGAVFTGCQYSSDGLDVASSVSFLFTGTCPYYHGIVGEQWLDRSTLRPVGCVEDARFRGVGTTDMVSPDRLLVSSLADELKIATDGRGLVYSIAPLKEAALFSAGHAGDWAIWLDDRSGAWVSTSYFGNAPSWQRYLDGKSIAAVSNITWKPLNSAIEHYNYFFSTHQTGSFSHRFTGEDRYRLFKTSGLVNSYVSSTVNFIINQTGVGLDDIPDLLNVCYYAGRFDGRRLSDCATELQDTYVRLDIAITELLQSIDRTVGLDNTVLFLTSTGYERTEPADMVRFKVPTGSFHTSRCAALLNMYLTAIYGQGKYVDASFGGQIYLNHKLIEQKQLNLSKVLESCEDFLYQFEGVRDVYTSTRLNQGAGTPIISRIRNAYNPQCSGDILIQVNPGWTVTDESHGTNHYESNSFFGIPLIFFGGHIQSCRVQSPVSAERIAPTIARLMRIRAPNACKAPPLTEVEK